MKQRILGKDLTVSEIGLGIMGITHAYGKPADSNEMLTLIQASLELGGNFFDTAPVYGKANEMLLGKALQKKRQFAIIATKFGIVGQTHSEKGVENTLDSSPKAILQQVEQSLTNLQTDYIDLYYQHRIDPNVPAEVVAEVMGKLIQQGKIRHWGVSNAPIDYMQTAHAITPITATENQYSMMHREPEHGLFEFCEKNNIGFVAYSPLGNGFLSGRFNQNTKYEEGDFRATMGRFKPDVMAKNQILLDYLAELAQQKNARPAQIVLAWELAQKPFIVPIPGTTKLHRLQENLDASNIVLTADEVTKINQHLDNMDIDSTYF